MRFEYAILHEAVQNGATSYHLEYSGDKPEVIHSNGALPLGDTLNRLGALGWELFSTKKDKYYFKRPVDETAAEKVDPEKLAEEFEEIMSSPSLPKEYTVSEYTPDEYNSDIRGELEKAVCAEGAKHLDAELLETVNEMVTPDDSKKAIGQATLDSLIRSAGEGGHGMNTPGKRAPKQGRLVSDVVREAYQLGIDSLQFAENTRKPLAIKLRNILKEVGNSKLDLPPATEEESVGSEILSHFNLHEAVADIERRFNEDSTESWKINYVRFEDECGSHIIMVERSVRLHKGSEKLSVSRTVHGMPEENILTKEFDTLEQLFDYVEKHAPVLQEKDIEDIVKILKPSAFPDKVKGDFDGDTLNIVELDEDESVRFEDRYPKIKALAKKLDVQMTDESEETWYIRYTPMPIVVTTISREVVLRKGAKPESLTLSGHEVYGPTEERYFNSFKEFINFVDGIEGYVVNRKEMTEFIESLKPEGQL